MSNCANRAVKSLTRDTPKAIKVKGMQSVTEPK